MFRHHPPRCAKFASLRPLAKDLEEARDRPRVHLFTTLVIFYSWHQPCRATSTAQPAREPAQPSKEAVTAAHEGRGGPRNTDILCKGSIELQAAAQVQPPANRGYILSAPCTSGQTRRRGEELDSKVMERDRRWYDSGKKHNILLKISHINALGGTVALG